MQDELVSDVRLTSARAAIDSGLAFRVSGFSMGTCEASFDDWTTGPGMNAEQHGRDLLDGSERETLTSSDQVPTTNTSFRWKKF